MTPVANAKSKAAAAKARATARAQATKARIDTLPTRHVARPIDGFMAFVREQGVVGLAIGLVLGTQVKTLVDQLVASFINPILGLLLPGNGSLTEKVFYLRFNGKGEDFFWGAFVSQLISFLTVAAIIYFVVKGLRLDKLDKKKD